MIELRLVGPDDWQAWRPLRLAALAEAPQAFSSVLADWQGEGDREDQRHEFVDTGLREQLPDSLRQEAVMAKDLVQAPPASDDT